MRIDYSAIRACNVKGDKRVEGGALTFLSVIVKPFGEMASSPAYYRLFYWEKISPLHSPDSGAQSFAGKFLKDPVKPVARAGWEPRNHARNSYPPWGPCHVVLLSYRITPSLIAKKNPTTSPVDAPQVQGRRRLPGTQRTRERR